MSRAACIKNIKLTWGRYNNWLVTSDRVLALYGNYSEKKRKKMSLVKKYNCSHCNYVSDRKWTIKDHEKRMHNHHGSNVEQNEIQNNRAPVTMSIGENVGRPPTSVFVGNDAPKAHTTMYTEPTHISKEHYNHALICINGWKNAHQKEVEEKHKLSKELHYEKVAKEALPICMDKIY